MKVTARFWLRAGLVLCAAGALGAFGACSKDTTSVQPPPPPPSPLPAPTGLTAAAASQTKINVTWAESDTSVTGFRLDRCTGAGCTNFAQITTTAKNVMTFGDDGLAANTSYSYRVRASRGADTSAWSATASATTGVIGGSTAFTMVGAGEIINTCPNSPGTLGTSHIVDSILTKDTSAIAFVAGDAQTDSVAGSTFASCYDKSGWGSFKNRTYFAIGNGDYAGGRAAAGVYSYFADRTGPESQHGTFSIDKGNWHIVFINTADWEGGAQSKDQLQSPSGFMNQWLAADLAAVPRTKCIAVFSWDRRIYTAGDGNVGMQFNLLQATSIMESAGADILVSSKDKLYARFPLMNHLGVKDSTGGFRQFIVGTGGRSFDQMITPTPTNPVEKQNGGAGGSFGVLKLTLDASSYSWEFIPIRAGGFTDSGGPVPCHTS